MSITQTVTVPENHRLIIDVPREVPAGATARLELSWFPKKESAGGLDTSLEKIRELCKDTPVSVDSFLEMRRQEKETEENRYKQFLSGNDN